VISYLAALLAAVTNAISNAIIGSPRLRALQAGDARENSEL
jgi:hypothetical protein